MTSKREERTVECDIRSANGASTICGYAAVFGTRADLGSFHETIAPGAFHKALSRDDVRALVNHDPNLILGRNKAGTLRLSEDSRGLAIEIDPPDTQLGRDLLVSMKRGDLNQMSFGFQVAPGGQRREQPLGSTKPLRVITEASLFDVSIVAYPAYPETSASVRGVRSAQEIYADLIGEDDYHKRQASARKRAFRLGVRLPNGPVSEDTQLRLMQLELMSSL